MNRAATQYRGAENINRLAEVAGKTGRFPSQLLMVSMLARGMACQFPIESSAGFRGMRAHRKAGLGKTGKNRQYSNFRIAMPAYLVRLIDNRQIVGFFFADHPSSLAVSVHEWTDSDRCEYVKLPTGGIVWAGSAVAVPMDPGAENDADWDIPELPFASATMSESWLNVLYGYPPMLRWTKLKGRRKSESKPDATPPQPPAPMGSAQVIPLRRPR